MKTQQLLQWQTEPLHTQSVYCRLNVNMSACLLCTFIFDPCLRSLSLMCNVQTMLYKTKAANVMFLTITDLQLCLEIYKIKKKCYLHSCFFKIPHWMSGWFWENIRSCKLCQGCWRIYQVAYPTATPEAVFETSKKYTYLS